MTDTIVAQATPEGISALAVIRVSGNLTRGLLLEACNLPHPTPRHAYYKRYLDLNGNSPDQIIVTYFESGKSFTSESSIEIICHGNPIIVNEIISDLLARGCRIADPGEFTFRAYQNGKIDLIQAEAIAELISAKSRRALELANKNLNGNLTETIREIQQNILIQQAEIEAFIDFPEDDLGEEQNSKIIIELDLIQSKIINLIKISKRIDIFNRKLNVVLIGPPNAGKSSIFNKIVGSERAIVDINPGTTRDFINHTVNLEDLEFELYDTAGIRENAKDIEKIGIRKSEEILRIADLIVMVLDASQPYPTKFEKQIEEIISTEKVLIVLNKNDLQQKLNSQSLPNILKDMIYTSTNNYESIEKLIGEIKVKLHKNFEIKKEYNVSVNLRQSNLLKLALIPLKSCIAKLNNQIEIELCVPDLKESIDKLSEIAGEKNNEDMLDVLFSSFCIGK